MCRLCEVQQADGSRTGVQGWTSRGCNLGRRWPAWAGAGARQGCGRGQRGRAVLEQER